MSTTTEAHGLPQVASAEVSNVIFLAGTALCVAGLALLIAAAALMCKTARYNKQIQIRERRVDGLSRKHDTETLNQAVPNTTSEITTTQRNHMPHVNSMQHSAGAVEAAETEFSENFGHRQWKTSIQHMQYMQDGAMAQDVGDDAPPDGCMGKSVKPYATNPIPDPADTAHYDTYKLQDCPHPSMYNELSRCDMMSAGMPASPRRPPRQHDNTGYLVPSPVPAQRHVQPQFYPEQTLDYGADRMSSMSRTAHM